VRCKLRTSHGGGQSGAHPIGCILLAVRCTLSHVACRMRRTHLVRQMRATVAKGGKVVANLAEVEVEGTINICRSTRSYGVTLRVGVSTRLREYPLFRLY
jgi:hypothetical protein